MQQLSTQLHQILNSNPSIFGLTFQGYKDGQVIFSAPSALALEYANRDVAIFEERQRAVYNRKEIAAGDWVKMPNGDYSRVTIDQFSESVQIGGYAGGSYYICKDGGCSYSGGCGEAIKRADLSPTDEYKDGNCWIFHNDQSGAHRGVHCTLKFKVWQYNK